jgi:putative membrane protein
MLRLTLAALHLIALGIGLGAVWGRSRALGAVAAAPEDGVALRRAFAADTWWGVAALLWISTGLWRWLAGTEKSPSYYASNHVFMAKMGLLVLILVLEVWPMVTLVRWRVAARRGASEAVVARSAAARRIALISVAQTALVLMMVGAAVAMARGYGAS